MAQKAFVVQVELDLQAITCPGVCLCTNGKVSLQIYMLDSCIQSVDYRPTFPIICNESFNFIKIYHVTTHRLNELQNELNSEWIYMELIQWQNYETGNVLAFFQTTLDDLLYPSSNAGSTAGIDVDLLMEATKSFPGTITPKIELRTKTTIKEIVCNQTSTSSTVALKPKLEKSHVEKRPQKKHNRKVCHSIEYSRKIHPHNQLKTKPPFCYRKAEDDLILRKPQSIESCTKDIKITRCRPPGPKTDLVVPKTSSQLLLCACGDGERDNACPVCNKYKGYFLSPAPDSSGLKRNNNRCCCHCRHCARDKSESGDSFDTNTDSRGPQILKKLHDKMSKTLNAIPTLLNNREQCVPEKSKVEVYRELQNYYKKMYEEACGKNDCKTFSHEENLQTKCVPDCEMYKCSY